ncbi:MAG: phosphate acyltransferase PlsX [Candidatus Omnitrophica bacterium]|nr:phosphate acyltransferase PlsX [Candidatus Omnitrophota bacterium]MBU2044778.1 phosphate acyltransferase PlsX [Candidatus Omnitrophota bacterium]MBU2265881.1 phosphate acyltransferase PlsX [Candidatus Omnitrophota bacterium]MBU2473994.1 phosphate acyltransferase PlsX [Candidatus Omnitrophota bacterium]
MSYKIGLDISGGDFAPGAIINGALLARSELKQDIVLIGSRLEIEEQLALNDQSADEFTIIDAPEKIEMAESPVSAVRRKKNSSIVVGINLLKSKQIDAFVSCGNTGAVVGAATLRLGLIPGVERPGIGLLLPTKTGVSLLIDVGANIDCKPMHLFQYGIMASVYYNLVLNKKNPSLGLLNIGEEASKGLGVIKDLHKLFTASPLNFIGNVEAKEIFSGKCDCIVCDGFIGNIALKVAEGSVEAMGRFLIETIKKGILGKIGLLLLLPNLKKFKRKMDYAEYGGAPLLGVDGVVIIGHGRSSALAVKNAIGVAVGELSRDLTETINRRVNEICQDSRIRQILTV